MRRSRDSRIPTRIRWHVVGRGLPTLVAALALTSVVFGLAWAADAEQRPSEGTASVNVTKKADLYDIDASGADIKFVVEALARCSGTNICVSPEVAGPVTAHLKQMSVDSILDHMSTAQGFGWRKDGDTYLLLGLDKIEKPVVPAPAPAEERVLVWECRYVKPADVVSAIKALFPNLRVAEGPGSTTPTLTEQSDGLSGSGSTASTSGSQGTTSAANSTSVLLYGDPADVAKARDALSQLDKARAQVSIQVAITEIDSTATKELGIEWAYGDVMLSEAEPGPDSGIKFRKFTRDGLSFTGTISALVKSGNAKLLAQPNISVVDGECASILIGDRILFPKLIGYSQTGTPIYDKEEEQVGIYLQIAPKVSGKDEMLLTLYPQVSLVTSFLKTQAGDYPQISTREARTTVKVKNGGTLSIGGLLRDDDIRSVSKIPLLGDLPFLGQFFRRNKTSRERTEIVIILSPTILSQE